MTRDLTDEEHAELSSAPTCCWETVYAKYTSNLDASKFLAFRRIRYTLNQAVQVVDVVSKEITDREDANGISGTHYDIFERDVFYPDELNAISLTETHYDL